MRTLIPRFTLPYGMGALASASIHALSGRVPSPREMATLVGDRELVWTGSGRQALSLMLAAMKLGANARIGIPLFSSSAVTAAVKAAGCEPVYLDIDPRTLTLDPAQVARVRSRVSAFVAVHLFGHAADMPRILDAASGVPVIEDTAQALSSYWRGKLAGTYGVGSFYSFASSKAIPAGGGGLAALNDPQLGERVRTLAAQLIPATRKASLRAAGMQYAKAQLFSRPLYGTLGNRLRASSEDTGFLLAKVDARAIAPSSAAAVLTLARTHSERAARQRAHSLHLIGALSSTPGILLPVEPRGARYGYSSFAVVAATPEERNEIRQIMLHLGIDTSALHHNSIETAAANGYRGGCPVSERVAERILMLPNSANLTAKDLDRVVSAFHTALERSRAAGRIRKLFEAHAI
jgi:perosamine synthetase